MAKVPVSIRTKNPGAMWPGSVSRKYGSTTWENLRDGNKAAIFPTFEQGAAAQFDLWARNYAGMTLAAAIAKWSGHNSSKAYAQFLAKKVPGIKMSDVITKEFLASPKGLQFMKAQAQWETGQPYPMSDAQWKAGQEMAFGHHGPPPIEKAPPAKPKPLEKSKTIWGGIIGWITSMASTFVGFFQYLNNPYTLAAFVLIVVILCVAFWLVIKGRIDVNAVVRKLSQQAS